MITVIDRDELQRLRREEDAQLIEVLSADEFEDEHLPGAVNVPLRSLDADATAFLDPHAAVIVYCYDAQ
jgi:rhodanese-related sulfurtransferase